MKVLFVGFGSIAQKHYQALKQVKPDVKFYALKSGSQSSGLADVCDIYNWSEVPNDLDFAIIANPTFKHVEALTNLISYGVPVFIEKPISNTLEGLEAIEKSLREKKIISYVACNLRFLPVLQYLKNELYSKISKVEEVSVYCGSYLPNWRPDRNYKEIYSANEKMGGGAHLDLFHELDYVCWLFGTPILSFGFLRSKSSLAIDAIDYASYQLIYTDFVTSIVLNYYRPDAKRKMEIVTQDRTYVIDLLNNSIVDNEGNTIFEESDFNISDTYAEQMKYFLGIIEGENYSINTFSESLDVLKICLNSERVN